MSIKPLNTTSYAILGVLAMKPWSAYELTNYMRTSAVHEVCSRTESRLYQEPKNLAAHGLVDVETEYVGKRKRTIYYINERGHDELYKWLGERSKPLEQQDEFVLKIFLGDQGSKTQILNSIHWAMEELHEHVILLKIITERVLSDEYQMPERIHIAVIAAKYAITKSRQRFEFLRWTEQWVRSWRGTKIDKSKRDQAIALIPKFDNELDILARDLSEKLKQ